MDEEFSLKPCPFCGCKEIRYNDWLKSEECWYCMAKGPCGDHIDMEWNDRYNE